MITYNIKDIFKNNLGEKELRIIINKKIYNIIDLLENTFIWIKFYEDHLWIIVLLIWRVLIELEFI